MRLGVTCSSSYYLDYSKFPKEYNLEPSKPPCELLSIQPTPKFATAEYESGPDYSSFVQRRKRSRTPVKSLTKSQGTRAIKKKNQKCEYPPEYEQIGDIKKKAFSNSGQKLEPEILKLNEDHLDYNKNYNVTSDQAKDQKAIRNVNSDPQLNTCLTYPSVDVKRRKLVRCFCTRKLRNKRKKQIISKVTCNYEGLCKKRIKGNETDIGMRRKYSQYREIPSLYPVYSSIISGWKNIKPKKKNQKVVTDLDKQKSKKQPKCICSKEYLCMCDKKSKSVCTCQEVVDTGSQTREIQSRCFSSKEFSCGWHLKSKSICTCMRVTDVGSQTQKKQVRCFCTKDLICVYDKKPKKVCTCQRLKKARTKSKLKEISKNDDAKYKRHSERWEQTKDMRIRSNSFGIPTQLNEKVPLKDVISKKNVQEFTSLDRQKLYKIFKNKMKKRRATKIEFKKIALKATEPLQKKYLIIKHKINQKMKCIPTRDVREAKSRIARSITKLNQLSERVFIRKSSRKKHKQKLNDESSQTSKEQPSCSCSRDFGCVCDKELKRVCPYDKLAKTRYISKTKNNSGSSLISKNQSKQRKHTGNSRIRSMSSDAQPHSSQQQPSEPVHTDKSREIKRNLKSMDFSSQTQKKESYCICSNDLFCVCDKKLRRLCKCDKVEKIKPVSKFKTTSDNLIVTSKNKSPLDDSTKILPQLNETVPIRKTNKKKYRHSKSLTHVNQLKLNEKVDVKKLNREKYQQKCFQSYGHIPNKQESRTFCIEMIKASDCEIKIKKIAQKATEFLRKKLILIKNQINQTKKCILTNNKHICSKSRSVQSFTNSYQLSEPVSIRNSSRKKHKKKLTHENNRTPTEQRNSCPSSRDFLCVCDKKLKRFCTYDRLTKRGCVSEVKNTSDSCLRMCKNQLKQRKQIEESRKRSKSLDAQPHSNLLQPNESIPIRKPRWKKHKPKFIDSSSQTWKKQPYCLCSNDYLCVCDKKFGSVCKCDKFGKKRPISNLRITSDSLTVTSKTKNRLKQRMQIQPQFNQSVPMKKTNKKTRRQSKNQTHKDTLNCRCSEDFLCVCDNNLKNVCTCETIRNTKYILKLKNDLQPKKEISNEHYKDVGGTSLKFKVINKNVPSESNTDKMSMPRPVTSLKISSTEMPFVTYTGHKNKSNKHIAHDVKMEKIGVISRTIKEKDHEKALRKQEKNQRQKYHRYVSTASCNRVKGKKENKQTKKKCLVATNEVAPNILNKNSQYKNTYHLVKQVLVNIKKHHSAKQANKNRRKGLIFSKSSKNKTRTNAEKKSSPEGFKSPLKIPRTVYHSATTESTSSARTRYLGIGKANDQKTINQERKLTYNGFKDLHKKRQRNLERASVQDPMTKRTLKSVGDHYHRHDKCSLAVRICKYFIKTKLNRKVSDEKYFQQDRSNTPQSIRRCFKDINKCNRGKTRQNYQHTLDRETVDKPFQDSRSVNNMTYSKFLDADSQLNSRKKHEKEMKKFNIEELELNTNREIKKNQAQQRRLKNIRHNILTASNPTTGYETSSSVRYCKCTNTGSVYLPVKHKSKKKKRFLKTTKLKDDLDTDLPKHALDTDEFQKQFSVTIDKKRRNVKQAQVKSLRNHENIFPSKSITDLKCAIVKSYYDCARLAKATEKLLNKHKKLKANHVTNRDKYSAKIHTSPTKKQREKVRHSRKTLFSKSEINSAIGCNCTNIGKKSFNASSNKIKKPEPINSKNRSDVNISQDILNPSPSSIMNICKYTKQCIDNFRNKNNCKKRRHKCKGHVNPVKTHSNSFRCPILSKDFINSMTFEEKTDRKLDKKCKRRFKILTVGQKQEYINPNVSMSAIPSKFTGKHRSSHINSISKSLKKDRDHFNIIDDYQKSRSNLKGHVEPVKTNSNLIKSPKWPVISSKFAIPVMDCTCDKISKRHFKPISKRVRQHSPVNSKIGSYTMKSKDTVNLEAPNLVNESENKDRNQTTNQKNIKKQYYNLGDNVDNVQTLSSPNEIVKRSKAFTSSRPAGADCVCKSQVNQHFLFKENCKNNENNEQICDIVHGSKQMKKQPKNIYSLPNKRSGICDDKVLQNEIPKKRNGYEFNQVNEYSSKLGPEYMSEDNKSEFYSPLEKCYLRKYNNTEGKLWKLKNNLITLQNYRASVIPRPTIISKPTYKLCECRHLPFKNKRLQKKQLRNSQMFAKRNDCTGKTDRITTLSKLKIKPKCTGSEQPCETTNKTEPYSTPEKRWETPKSIFNFRNLKEIKGCGHDCNKYICNDTQITSSRPCVSKGEVAPIINECMRNNSQTPSKCTSKNKYAGIVKATSACCRNRTRSNILKRRYKCFDDGHVETKKCNNFSDNNVLQISDIPNIDSVMLFCKCGDKTIKSKKHKVGKRKEHSQTCKKVYNCGNNVKINKCAAKSLDKTSCQKSVTVVSAPKYSCGCTRKTGPYLVIENCSENIKANNTQLNPKMDYYIGDANVKLYNSKTKFNITSKHSSPSDNAKRKAGISWQFKKPSKTSRKKSADANTLTEANTQSFCSSLCQKVKSVLSGRMPLVDFVYNTNTVSEKHNRDKSDPTYLTTCLCHKTMLLRSKQERIKRAKLLAKEKVESDRFEKMHFIEMEKKLKTEQKKLMEEAKDVAQIDESYGTHCISDFFVGVIAIGVRTAKCLVKSLFKTIIQPKRSYKFARHVLKNPTRTIKHIKQWGSIIWQRQFLRMVRSIRGSRAMSVIADELEEQPLYQSFVSRKTTPKGIMAAELKSRMRRRRRDLRYELAMKGCNNNLFIQSLRQMPCFWVYHVCPLFYPQCLTILKVWRDYVNLILFCLAIFVWSPCILAFEICRSVTCCLLCTR